MRKVAILVALSASLTFAARASAVPVGYDFQGTANYQFGAPATLCCGPAGAPDTGFITIDNAGLSTFSGNMGFNAVSGFGTNFDSSYAVTLTPGQSVSLSINNESSNQGGYNGTYGTTQNGAQFFMDGTVSRGALTETVSLSIYDSQIHSGVFQTNPFGVSLDNYILQGGDPLGRDTGDGFETAQAPGLFSFTEASVPEPASLTFLASALFGATGFAWRRRNAQ